MPNLLYTEWQTMCAEVLAPAACSMAPGWTVEVGAASVRVESPEPFSMVSVLDWQANGERPRWRMAAACVLQGGVSEVLSGAADYELHARIGARLDAMTYKVRVWYSDAPCDSCSGRGNHGPGRECDRCGGTGTRSVP